MANPAAATEQTLEFPTTSDHPLASAQLISGYAKFEQTAVDAVTKLAKRVEFRHESTRQQQRGVVGDIYDFYTFVCASHQSWEDFCHAEQITAAKSDSTPANTLVRYVFEKANCKPDRPQMSLWSTIIDFAFDQGIPNGGLPGFIISNNGLVNVARLARRETADIHERARDAVALVAAEQQFRLNNPAALIQSPTHTEVVGKGLALAVVEVDPVEGLRLVAIQDDSGKVAAKALRKIVEESRSGPRPRKVAKRRHSFTGGDSHPIILADDAEPYVNMRTMHLHLVTAPGEGTRVIKSGEHNRKLGSVVVKGDWEGYPVYGFMLEERATCPTTCKELKSCYGNGMSHVQAKRFEHGPALELALDSELQILACEPGNRAGFALRVHTLGDFYSPEYAELYDKWLSRHQNLHIWGYTAHEVGSETGQVINKIMSKFPDRFLIRWSGQTGELDGTSVVADESEFNQPIFEDSIICPVNTHSTDCCATCALCWSSSKHVVFLRH